MYIGLRSLRLRTLDQNLLVVPNSIVPNSMLAQMQFQNMKARSKLLISQNFSLRIETRRCEVAAVSTGRSLALGGCGV